MPRRQTLGPRLSLQVLHLLLALTDGPLHGYAIRQQVAARTEGDVRLGIATLYEAIQRLLEAGLIEEARRPDAANGQEAQRRYYRLSSRGWDVLADEVRRVGALVDFARTKPRLA